MGINDHKNVDGEESVPTAAEVQVTDQIRKGEFSALVWELWSVVSRHVLHHLPDSEIRDMQDSACSRFFDLWLDGDGWTTLQGGTRRTHLSCSPVTRTSASLSSSAAFFCMVDPILSITSLQRHQQLRHQKNRRRPPLQGDEP